MLLRQVVRKRGWNERQQHTRENLIPLNELHSFHESNSQKIHPPWISIIDFVLENRGELSNYACIFSFFLPLSSLSLSFYLSLEWTNTCWTGWLCLVGAFSHGERIVRTARRFSVWEQYIGGKCIDREVSKYSWLGYRDIGTTYKCKWNWDYVLGYV